MSDLGASERRDEGGSPDARWKCVATVVAGVTAFWTIQTASFSFIPEAYLLPSTVLALVEQFVDRFMNTSEGLGAVLKSAVFTSGVMLMLVAAVLYVRWWMSHCDERTASTGAGCSALRVLVGVSTVYLATVWIVDARSVMGYSNVMPWWQYLLCGAAIVGGAVLGWSKPDRFRPSVRTTYFSLWLVTWCCPIPLTM